MDAASNHTTSITTGLAYSYRRAQTPAHHENGQRLAGYVGLPENGIDHAIALGSLSDKAVCRTSEFMPRRRDANLRFRGITDK
jgi:hypothetical protein